MSSRCITTYNRFCVAIAWAATLSLFGSPANAADPPTPNATPQISGVVFYRLKSGASVILRGLTIYVMDESEVRNNPGIVVGLATLKITMQTAEIVEDCDRLGGLKKLIEKAAIYKATTSIDAKYSFQGLAQGDYHVFAFLDSSAANGVWDVPVKLRDDSIKLDLDNSNISAVCDLSAR